MYAELLSFLVRTFLWRYGRCISIAYSHVMRRHNFHALFVEAILNVLMQCRINISQPVCILDIRIHLIHRIPVAERGGKYKRTRIVHHSGSIQGSFNQKFVDYPLRHVITDAYLRMDNQSRFPGRLAEVHRMRRHDK